MARSKQDQWIRPTQIGMHGQVAATKANLSQHCLSASQHLNTPCQWSLGFSSLSLCPNVLPPAKGAGLFLCRSFGTGTPSLSQSAQSPRTESTRVVFISLLDPSWGTGPNSMLFSPHPTQLHRNLSCSLGCIRDLLPVSGWFFMRIVSRVDVFLMCLWEEVKSKFLLCHCDPPPKYSLF